MLPSAETSRDSQAMSSSRSEQSAARETCGVPTLRPPQYTGSSFHAGKFVTLAPGVSSTCTNSPEARRSL
jgi:hypothetical protein